MKIKSTVFTQKNIDKKQEYYKVLPIGHPGRWRESLKFRIQLLFDLQSATIYWAGEKYLGKFSGKVVDIGCGSGYVKSLLPKTCEYIGLEKKDIKKEFNYEISNEVVYYEGKKFPFKDNFFDGLICTEVLEHVENYGNFLKECRRVLKRKGKVFFSVPFSARWHYLTSDFWRFTPMGLLKIFTDGGFKNVLIENRGTDITVACYKTNSIIVRWLTGAECNILRRLFKIILALMFSPLFLLLTAMGIISIKFSLGSDNDCLGYTILVL